jgi:hypothetical protein
LHPVLILAHSTRDYLLFLAPVRNSASLPRQAVRNEPAENCIVRALNMRYSTAEPWYGFRCRMLALLFYIMYSINTLLVSGLWSTSLNAYWKLGPIIGFSPAAINLYLKANLGDMRILDTGGVPMEVWQRGCIKKHQTGNWIFHSHPFQWGICFCPRKWIQGTSPPSAHESKIKASKVKKEANHLCQPDSKLESRENQIEFTPNSVVKFWDAAGSSEKVMVGEESGGKGLTKRYIVSARAALTVLLASFSPWQPLRDSKTSVSSSVWRISTSRVPSSCEMSPLDRVRRWDHLQISPAHHASFLRIVDPRELYPVAQ